MLEEDGDADDDDGREGKMRMMMMTTTAMMFLTMVDAKMNGKYGDGCTVMHGVTATILTSTMIMIAMGSAERRGTRKTEHQSF